MGRNFLQIQSMMDENDNLSGGGGELRTFVRQVLIFERPPGTLFLFLSLFPPLLSPPRLFCLSLSTTLPLLSRQAAVHADRAFHSIWHVPRVCHRRRRRRRRRRCCRCSCYWPPSPSSLLIVTAGRAQSQAAPIALGTCFTADTRLLLACLSACLFACLLACFMRKREREEK